MRLFSSGVIVLFSLCLLGAGSAEAKTHYFLRGDAYFIAKFHPKPWLSLEPRQTLRLSYFPERVMRCGSHGLREVVVGGDMSHLKRFVASLPALKRLRPASGTKFNVDAMLSSLSDRRGYWIAFYPRNYDLDKYGFGVRYNESYKRVDYEQRSDKHAWMSSKYATSVPPLRITGGFIRANKVDVYIFGGEELEVFTDTREGAVIYRLRDGKGEALQFRDGHWLPAGDPNQLPLSENSWLRQTPPMFPAFELDERQQRRLKILKGKALKKTH